MHQQISTLVRPRKLLRDAAKFLPMTYDVSNESTCSFLTVAVGVDKLAPDGGLWCYRRDDELKSFPNDRLKAQIDQNQNHLVNSPGLDV